MSDFSTASKVMDTIRAGDRVERERSSNRVKINALANGAPPLSKPESDKMGMKININWGEGPVLFSHARRQYNSAFLGQQNFFKVQLPLAPPEKRTEWEIILTNAINKPMKRSSHYAWIKKNQFSSVVLHGVGVQTWYDPEDWCPELVAIEDFRVPTDTVTSFKKTEWYAIRKQWTPGELADKAFSKTESRRWKWNKDAVAKILDRYKEMNFEQTAFNWLTSPEKMAELNKQNLGYSSGDAMPSISLWHFYYYDRTGKKRGWRCCLLPEAGKVKGADNSESDFLCESKDFVAQNLSQLISIQTGDLNNKPPFMYHSIRSLGFLLMEPCTWTNLFRCRYMQHAWENMNVWLRNSDPSDRGRASKVEFFDKAVIPQSFSIVPQQERHQIEPQLVESVLAQMKQLMAEASSTYTQQTDSGTAREQTAFETHVKLSQVNAMLSGLLTDAFGTETFAYREISRRFCNLKSEDEDVRAFQKEVLAAGVDKVFIDVDQWEIQPEIPMGAGNPSMALSQAQQLMGIRLALSPTAQQEVIHGAIAVITGDPKKADRLAPIGGQQDVTDAQRDAEFAFATLMQGVPVRMKEGLSPVEQIDTLTGLLSGKIAKIEQTTNMASPADIAGMQTVEQYVGQLIQQLAQDPEQKPLVKAFSEALGKLMNSVKAFEQRNQKAMAQANGNGVHAVRETLGMNYKDLPEDIKRQAEAQAGFTPSSQPVTDPKMLKTVHGMAVKDAQAHQDQLNKQVDFSMEQKRKDAETVANIARTTAEAKAQKEAQPAVESNGKAS